jgi:hypothetical protein
VIPQRIRSEKEFAKMFSGSWPESDSRPCFGRYLVKEEKWLDAWPSVSNMQKQLTK